MKDMSICPSCETEYKAGEPKVVDGQSYCLNCQQDNDPDVGLLWNLDQWHHGR